MGDFWLARIPTWTGGNSYNMVNVTLLPKQGVPVPGVSLSWLPLTETTGYAERVGFEPTRVLPLPV